MLQSLHAPEKIESLAFLELPLPPQGHLRCPAYPCSVKVICGGGELCYLSQISTKTPIVFGPSGFSELVALYASKSRLRWDSLVRWLRGPVCLDPGFCGILAAVVQGLPS